MLKWISGASGEKKHFEQFASALALGLDKDQEARRISTLLYCLGEEANDVLSSTNITSDDRKKYDSVVEKLDDYFQVRRK